MDADRIAASEATKNVTAFLHAIRECEGTNTPDGYRALFGYRPGNGHTFASYAQHPNIMQPFTETDGTSNCTTAAGAYQFLYSTWRRIQTKLKLPDFSPSCQDIAAMELIAGQGAMPYVKSGNVLKAFELCAPIWASLPNSKYPQPKRSTAYALAAFIDNGGMLA